MEGSEVPFEVIDGALAAGTCSLTEFKGSAEAVVVRGLRNASQWGDVFPSGGGGWAVLMEKCYNPFGSPGNNGISQTEFLENVP